MKGNFGVIWTEEIANRNSMKQNFGVIWTEEIEIEELEAKVAPDGQWALTNS